MVNSLSIKNAHITIEGQDFQDRNVTLIAESREVVVKHYDNYDDVETGWGMRPVLTSQRATIEAQLMPMETKQGSLFTITYKTLDVERTAVVGYEGQLTAKEKKRLAGIVGAPHDAKAAVTGNSLRLTWVEQVIE